MSAAPRIALLKSRRLAHELGQAHDGGTVHVVKQLEALIAAGFEIDLFTRNEARETAGTIEVMAGFRLWRIPFTRSKSRDLFLRDLEEGRSFVEGVLACPGFSAASFDAVVLHHWTSGVDIAASLPETLPLLFTPHLLASEKAHANGLALPEPVAILERQLLARADCTITMSRDEEGSCVHLGARRVQLVANGVSEAFFELPAAQRPAPNGVIKLGSVGRLCAQKGVEILLEAVRQLVTAGLDVQLDVVGSSYGEDAFEAEISRRLLDPLLSRRVRMLGPVPHQDLPDIVSSWNIYLQPSRYESQGIALLEAMAAGRYVIATGLPAVGEFLDDRAGRLIPMPPSPEDIVGAVRRALEDQTWSARILVARERARTYRWETTTQGLLRSLTETIDATQRRDRREQRRLCAEIETEARTLSKEIAASSDVSGILLLGSAARGAPKPGSDIDLLVVSDDVDATRQDWSTAGEHPADVKWEATASLLRLVGLTAEAFAESVAEHPIIDYLARARALTPLRPDLDEALPVLLLRRSDPHIQALIALRKLELASGLFAAAERLACDMAPADAQVKANAGSQLMLEAVLIRLGWTLRSAKRRLEVAVPYARCSSDVRSVVAFLTDAVGIDGVNIAHAAEIVSARMRMRTLHVQTAQTLNVADPELERARRHAGMAADYYSAAIERGYLKGCINHIRSFSGVPLMPGSYAEWLGLDPRAAARSFLTCDNVPLELRELWIRVMSPKSASDLVSVGQQGATLARELAAAS